MYIQFGGFRPDQRDGTHTMSRNIGMVVTLAAAIWLLAVAPCLALECPAPRPTGSPDAIPETQMQIDELAEILAAGDLANRMPAFVHALRVRHPDAPAGELVNYLITAYCPVVNRMTIGDAEKRARLDAFASLAAKAAF
jgi:hypothetical protein